MVRETTFLASGKCPYPTGVDQVSKYCAFGECFKKYINKLFTSTAGKN